MNSVELPSEETINIEEIKQELVDSGDENIEEDIQRCITVKSELSTFGTASQWQDDSQEEEVKSPVALFLHPDEDLEESAEEQQMKSELNMFEPAAEGLNDLEEEELKPLAAVFIKEEVEENLEEQQDTLTASDNILHSGEVTEENTGGRVSSPGWGGGCWGPEDQRDVQWPLQGGATENSKCAVSMETEPTLHKSLTVAKLFQWRSCIRRCLNTNTVASHVTHSEGRRVSSTSTEIFPTEQNANVVVPVHNGGPVSTEHSGSKNQVHEEGIPHVPSDPEKLKKQQNPSNVKCALFAGDTQFLSGKKQYECGECKKRFSRKSNLVVHFRIHTGEKPYVCGQCTRCFNTNSNLVKHIRTHTGERPYECRECNKRFADISDLVKHNRTHTGEKPYECQECKKRFANKSNLIQHSGIHVGKKPYVQKVEAPLKRNQTSIVEST